MRSCRAPDFLDAVGYLAALKSYFDSGKAKATLATLIKASNA